MRLQLTIASGPPAEEAVRDVVLIVDASVPVGEVARQLATRSRGGVRTPSVSGGGARLTLCMQLPECRTRYWLDPLAPVGESALRSGCRVRPALLPWDAGDGSDPPARGGRVAVGSILGDDVLVPPVAGSCRVVSAAGDRAPIPLLSGDNIVGR